VYIPLLLCILRYVTGAGWGLYTAQARASTSWPSVPMPGCGKNRITFQATSMWKTREQDAHLDSWERISAKPGLEAVRNFALDTNEESPVQAEFWSGAGEEQST
jgi:hypothetical protein